MSMLQAAIRPFPPEPVRSSSPSIISVASANHAHPISNHQHDATDIRIGLLASYLCDVLGLHGEATEEDLDQQIQAEAKTIGLDAALTFGDELNVKDTVGLRSTLERDGRQRSQESLVSRSSRSTGFISIFSDASRSQYARDHRTHKTASIASRKSFFARDYDGIVTADASSRRPSSSFSPPITPSRSTFSLALSSPSPSSSPKRHFRRIRGLSILKLGRNESRSSLKDGCPHCVSDPPSGHRTYHRLSCGHQLCSMALRQHIIGTTVGDQGGIPSCCGQPIPGRLIETALTLEEQGYLLDRREHLDNASSRTTSLVGERRSSSAFRPNAFTAFKRSSSRASKIDSLVPSSVHEFDPVTEHEDFKQLRQRQRQDRTRFATWLEGQHNRLHAQYISDKRAMQHHHDTVTDQLIDQQSHAMSEAEDKQVKAEADMRQVHEKEIQDNATALKHILAYCNGTYSSGDPHGREVTDQDRAELAKTQRTRELMDSRHSSAINVLRGEQSRRIRLRGMRQEKELQDLQRVHEAVDAKRDFTHERHIRDLDDFAHVRRLRMQRRWRLQTAILLRTIENETGVAVGHNIPEAEWELDDRLPQPDTMLDQDAT